VTILLNAWFIVPFTAYYGLVDAPGGEDLWDSAVYLNQMFATFVNNSGEDLRERGRTNGEMPLSLGGIIGIGLIIFVYVVYINKNNSEEVKGLVKAGKVSLLFGLAAAFAASMFFPWYDIWPLNIFFHIQFAWRFFIVAAPLLSLPAGIGFYLLFKKTGIQDRLAVFVIICTVIAGSAYYIDSIIQSDAYKYGISEFSGSWEYGDYKYRGSDQQYTLEHRNTITASSDEIGIDLEEDKNGRYVIAYKNSGGAKNAWIELPVYNFPGYEAYLDGQFAQLSIMSGTNNFIRIILPAGSSNGIIKLYYRGLGIFIGGNLVSAITLVFFLMCIFRQRSRTVMKQD
jgi:hypothetical protein